MSETSIKFLAAAFGSMISYFFGGWSDLLAFFTLTIAIDYVTGILASIKTGKGLNSAVGFWGITRKGLMLVMIILAHRIDHLFGLDYVMTGTIYFYLANEFISIAENYGRLGLPMPEQLKRIIGALKDNSNKNIMKKVAEKKGKDTNV